MSRNNINKVEALLDCCVLVGENMPDDDGDAENKRLKQKLKGVKQTQATLDSHFLNTQ